MTTNNLKPFYPLAESDFQYCLHHYGIIQISNDQAAEFLQGQLTCDINKLNENSLQGGAYCNIKGRLIVNGYLWQTDNKIFFLLAKDLIAKTLSTLGKYAKFSRVQLDDVSDEWHLQGWAGPNVHNFLLANQLPYFQLHNQHYLSISKTKPDMAFSPTHAQLWDYLHCQHKQALIYHATSEQFTPQEIEYDQSDAVCFNKGCYLGQEIIARMHYKASAKKHLYLATIEHPPRISLGTDIIDAKHQRKVGIVINSLMLDQTRQYLLLCLQDAYAQESLLINEVPLLLNELTHQGE